MSFENYKSMLWEMGKANGIDLEPDDTGFCSLEIDSSILLNMQYVGASDSIYLFYELAEINPRVLAQACPRLLSANLFGMETGGGMLAMQKDSYMVVFSYVFSANVKDVLRFQQVAENTLKYALYWKEEIQAMNNADMQPQSLNMAEAAMMRV